jgi:hypothetical protein
LVIEEKKQKKGKEKMAVIELTIFATLIITIIIAVKIYKD